VISVGDALQLLAEETHPLDPVEVPLDRCQGLVLAEAIAADRDLPPTDRSAMDGFAVRAEDILQEGQKLDVVGELRAGRPVGDLHVGRGQAVRIMTGAIVPPGADAVVMVERTTELDHRRRVGIDERPRKGQHIRRRAEDLPRGEVAVGPGAPIHAPEIAALASVGQVDVRVHRAPVVHVLSTGDEVVEPGRAAADHQVRNSNAYALLAQLADLGVAGRYLGIAGDERGVLEDWLDRGLSGDLLLVTGGVSVGDYDLVGDALAAAGMRRLFHKVAVKPGKPILAGRADDCLVFGLPGNPVSTYTAFAVFVAPALRRMQGYRRWENQRLPAVLAEPLRARRGRETYHLARLTGRSEGLTASPVAHAGSGDVFALARANGFIVTPESGASLAAGAGVSALLWKDFDLR
jgi:molybdopterin molybdotransferase